MFEDLYDYMESLQLIHDLDSSIIYPGHGNIVEDPNDKIKYYIDHRNKREQQILELLRERSDQALSVMEIVKVIYIATPSHLHRAAALNVHQHLIKLLKEDKIVEIEKSGECLWQIKQSSNL